MSIAGLASRATAAEPEGQTKPETKPEPLTKPVELRHDFWIDVPVIAGLLGAYIVDDLVRDNLQPSTCRWCDGPKPNGVNAVDDWFRTAFRRSDPKVSNAFGGIFAYGAAPLVGGGLTVLAAASDHRLELGSALTDLSIIAEGTLSATLVSAVASSFVLRERPAVHAITDPDAHQLALETKPDALRSFPSGHVTFAFGLAAAAGTVSSMRGYRVAPLVWVAGMMIGVATAYMRMASDVHYFTDTLGSAATGVTIGGGVPWLFHGPVARSLAERSAVVRTLAEARVGTTTVSGGRLVSLGWSF